MVTARPFMGSSILSSTHSALPRTHELKPLLSPVVLTLIRGLCCHNNLTLPSRFPGRPNSRFGRTSIMPGQNVLWPLSERICTTIAVSFWAARMNWADSQRQATIAAPLESNNIHASLPRCPTSLPNTGPQARLGVSNFAASSLARCCHASPTIPEMGQNSVCDLFGSVEVP